MVREFILQDLLDVIVDFVLIAVVGFPHDPHFADTENRDPKDVNIFLTTFEKDIAVHFCFQADVGRFMFSDYKRVPTVDEHELLLFNENISNDRIFKFLIVFGSVPRRQDFSNEFFHNFRNVLNP